MTDTDSQTTRTELDAIVEALHRDKRKRVRKLLRGMHVGKVASLLEALDGPQRMALWQHIDDDREEQVLKHLTPLLGAQLRREPDTSDLTDEEEEEYVMLGLTEVDKALDLNTDYIEALTYKNILMRMQANLTEDLDLQEQLIAEADLLESRCVPESYLPGAWKRTLLSASNNKSVDSGYC